VRAEKLLIVVWESQRAEGVCQNRLVEGEKRAFAAGSETKGSLSERTGGGKKNGSGTLCKWKEESVDGPGMSSY